MNDILPDVNIVVDICTERSPYFSSGLEILCKAKKQGHRVWIYAGSVHKYKIDTHLLFVGNITRQPYFHNVQYRINGKLANTDIIMNDTFWIGVYPGLIEEILDFVVDKLKNYFHVEGEN